MIEDTHWLATSAPARLVGRNGSIDYPPPAKGERGWPPRLAVAVAIALQLLLPARLTVGPVWLLPSLEAVLLLALIFNSPLQVTGPHSRRRQLSLALTAVVSITNAISLGLLSHLLFHKNIANGRELIVSGALIWLTNVLIFALWYWQLDRGGPGRRAAGQDGPPDFQFTQMQPGSVFPTWRPQFGDYLYLALTNGMAVSPTDVMPLTLTAKALMGLQSLISLLTIVLIVSPAVGIL